MINLKKFESFSNGKCDRCGNTSNTTTMSVFNTDFICMKCKEDERRDPDYKAAKAAEEAEVRKGNYNYLGVYPDYKPIVESVKKLNGEFTPLINWTKDKLGYDVILLNKLPRKWLGKHFSHNKTIEIYTKGRTNEQITDTLNHEIGHIIDYKRRGIIADPMGDSVIGWDGELRTAADHDIYFRDNKKIEADAIRKSFPRTDSASTTQKEIYADAYKFYRNDPEKLKEIAPRIYKEIDDFILKNDLGYDESIKESENIEFLTDRDMEMDIKDICLELIDTGKITFEIQKIRNTKMKCICIRAIETTNIRNGYVRLNWSFYKDTALRLKDYIGDRYSSFWYEKVYGINKKNADLSESTEIPGNILGIYIKYRPRKFTSLF